MQAGQAESGFRKVADDQPYPKEITHFFVIMYVKLPEEHKNRAILLMTTHRKPQTDRKVENA